MSIVLTTGGRSNPLTAGSVSSPSWYFEGDPDTGFYQPSVDTIGIAAGGSEIARVTTGGLQMLGNPILLDIAANGGVRIQDGGAEVAQLRDSTNARGLNMTLTAAGRQRLVSSSGDLEIGAGGADALIFMTNGLTRWYIANATHLLPETTNSSDIGSAAATVRSLYLGTSIVVPTILLDSAANGGVRIQDGGANVLQIWDSSNARGFTLTVSAAGDPTIVASGGDLLIGGSGGIGRLARLGSVQSTELTLTVGTTGLGTILGIVPLDEDGTDHSLLEIYGVGGRTGVVNTERLTLGYLAATTEFVVRSAVAGSGTQRELSLQTGTTKRIRMNGTGLALYDATPVARAAAIAAPTGGATIDTESRTAINSIRTALTNIGLTA